MMLLIKTPSLFWALLLLLCAVTVPSYSQNTRNNKEESPSYPRHMDPIEPRVYYHGDRTEKTVALTIDDGWVEDPELIELLLKHDVPATLFLPGRVIASRPEWVKELHNFCKWLFHLEVHPALISL